ncbi:MAG: VPLPA-CTERM-specific exosortase XrtD [Methylococcaceae bacterium]|nr:VPLPA-CTERM-specific exosortase XrtD [Methylococcaceae bacterium]
MTALFFEIINLLIGNWLGSEAYSHSIMIPFIIAFLIWQKQNELARFAFTGSWPGVALLIAGIVVYLFGELASLQILLEYALLIALLGAAWAIVGPSIFKRIWVPIFFLFFAIPLPNFLYHQLSAKMQLLSSQLGVSFIRYCNISVFLEGNVIDLGAMQLQVVEACSGLTYLFPLISVAFMCAYFYQAAYWKRAIIVLSSIPITILMNSFRIGVIGVLVEFWGKPMAEGFLHDFEGWIVFMGCTAILVGEIWILSRVGKDPRPLQEVFGLTLPEPWPAGTNFRERKLPKQFWVASFLLLAALGLSSTVERRQEIIPLRATFLDFPLKLGEWVGRRQVLEQQYIDALKFEDYILADYLKSGDLIPVNFYSAYYASQRQGESIHSPRSCLPGGGWQIQSLERVPVNLDAGNAPLTVNRVLIQKGEDRQLVYYWFRQRGRNITDEYMAKWYLFWDALTRNRTDGALIRLTVYVPKHEDTVTAEGRLKDILREIEPQLGRFIKD